jgi:RsiW-degrading membrane proteinase PrsW (M82 family)
MSAAQSWSWLPPEGGASQPSASPTTSAPAPAPTPQPAVRASSTSTTPSTSAGGQAATTIAQAKATVVKLWDSAPSPSELLPIRSFWENKDWTKGLPVVFLAFAAAPFVFLQSISPSDSMGKVAWCFSAYFAVMWMLAMYALIRPGRLDPLLLAKIGLASAITGAPIAIWLEERLAESSSLATNIYGVGLPEEFAKALPVFVVMFVLAERDHFGVRMFMFMGAVSGCVFGSLEAVNYSKLYASQVVQGQAVSTFSTELLWRLVAGGLFHACMAAITCYFIGLAARNPRWRVQLIGFGILLTATIHGVHNTYSQGYSEAAIAVFGLFVFLGYVLAADKIETKVQQQAAQPVGV